MVADSLCRFWCREGEEGASAKCDYGNFVGCVVGANGRIFNGVVVPCDLFLDKFTLLVSLWVKAMEAFPHYYCIKDIQGNWANL